MATPTLGLTFQDLLIRVAEYLGVADYTSGPAAVPTDTHDLDMVKRIVNDGYARFIGEHTWTWLTGEVTITPDGTNFKFDMPDDFEGQMDGVFTYPTTGPVAYMQQTTEEHLRRMRSGREVTGYPSLFAFEPKVGVDETDITPGWQVVFWPTPVSTLDTLTGKYPRFPNKLTNLTDRSIAGSDNDQAVKQACIAAAEVQRYGQQGPQEALYQTFLTAAMRKDSAKQPQNLGYNADGSDEYLSRGRWPSRANQVDTYNGISVE